MGVCNTLYSHVSIVKLSFKRWRAQFHGPVSNIKASSVSMVCIGINNCFSRQQFNCITIWSDSGAQTNFVCRSVYHIESGDDRRGLPKNQASVPSTSPRNDYFAMHAIVARFPVRTVEAVEAVISRIAVRTLPRIEWLQELLVELFHR